ncbi:MAG: acetyl-CoA carboxylase biotin carboxyl carrier protein subunit [Angelakisella sp.]|nr:acetyl-CoA carboxylase biotin carboxyl carrier protein subunit [Angelakisella sp.]
MKRFLIKINGKTYDAEVEVLGASAAAPAPAAAPKAAAPAPAPAAPAAAPKAGGPANVTSPLPGTVLRLVKNAGDTVAAGEVVMIVESMKMENEVVAPEAGRIASIAVAAGSAINTGDLLFTLG